ncbi:AAA family ATPase [Myroides marinus]|nr:ATP-binding protein [Myroides marinus]MDM1346733.1 ATP-binding protein [Myroides marinus]MDM1355144.1 ATP-binding protein [Myroides marinus]MDM1362176.1 ATP-binding protein [Myroides marinus]MDM1369320.1 ATP-binding protein [Myroides marinus]MDM1403667.1 ATP-binding protein [Myroides marinus]
MIAGNLRTHTNHVYDYPVKLLRAGAIYGANGAGKSNLIKAISYLKDLVEEGEVNQSINSKKFKLDQSYLSKPVFFEIEIVIDSKFYSYGVRIDGITILEEYLYETGNIKEDKLVFHRHRTIENKTTIQFEKNFVKTKKNQLLIQLLEDNILLTNQLLLSKYDILNYNIVSFVWSQIVENIVVIYPQTKFAGLTELYSYGQSFKYLANNLLSSFNTGIKHLEEIEIPFDQYFGEDDKKGKESILESLDEGSNVSLYDPSLESNVVITRKESGEIVVKKLTAKHLDINNNEVTFELQEESDGTRRLLDFIPALASVLVTNTTYIIDEIDQSLHPVLLKTLLARFLADDEVMGQFIFTTHESNLLDLNMLRQDEIWFVEKSEETKASQIYSLNDFKPRSDLDIKKGYLQGRFGAIPFTGDLENLSWGLEDEVNEDVTYQNYN